MGYPQLRIRNTISPRKASGPVSESEFGESLIVSGTTCDGVAMVTLVVVAYLVGGHPCLGPQSHTVN